jgi:hydroxyquinol 1,2-dioxygenase
VFHSLEAEGGHARHLHAADGCAEALGVAEVHHAPGPVGGLLRASGRHAWRPAHFHFRVLAEGYAPLTTELFPADDPYIDQDAVFGVRESLIAQFKSHAAGTAPDGRAMATAFHSAHYDFHLVPSSA